jgi:hypothetical protein
MEMEEKILESQLSEETGESRSALIVRQKKIMETKHRFHKLLISKMISNYAKASKFVELIDETFSQLWILSRHVAIIIEHFKALFGEISRTDFFGSYCVDIVVQLFARIVDVHNFEIVMELLNSSECAAVYCRVGFLNIFNPMKPENTLELSMDRYEERVVAKMIVYLSVDEPGINLTFKQFQWKRELDPTPGWDVTESWLSEQGLTTHGKFCFTYYSGEGKNKFGCIPNLKLRRALLQLVLIDENEIIDENDVPPEEYMNTAIVHFDENRAMWHDYLVPGCGR